MNINTLKMRAMQLHGEINGQHIGKYTCDRLDELEKARQNPESRQKSMDFLKEYSQCTLSKSKPSDVEKMFHSIRLMEVQTVISASTNFGSFFEIVNLAPDEQAELINEWGIETSFSVVGDGNKPRTITVDKTVTNQFVNLTNVSSDRVKYPLIDLQRGRVDDVHKKTLRMAEDWVYKLDGMAYDLLTYATPSSATVAGGAYGTFVTTGSKSIRSYIPNNSRLRTANLPTTNDIEVGTPTGSTYFDLPTLKAIVKYGALWGDKYGLRPTGKIYLPSVDIDGPVSGIATSTTVINTLGEALLQDGYARISALGITWTIIPDNTLPTGTCYPEYNKPVGKLFLKPAFDKDRTERDEDENWETAWQIRPMALVMPWPYRINTARFTYKTA